MKILGISAVTNVLSVALIDGEKLLRERTVTGEQAHSENLIFFIGQIFKEAKLSVGDLQAVAVTKGPGSYSGIRGSLATAKALAQALLIPVIGVSTLEAMAYGAEGEEILVVLDACREEFNVAKFQKVTRLRQDFGGQAEGYRRLQEDEVVDTSEVMARLKVVPPETILVFSEKIAGNRDIQSQVSGHKKRIVTYPKGENVARLGLGIIEKGDSPSLFAVQPKYSHHPNIRTFPGAR